MKKHFILFSLFTFLFSCSTQIQSGKTNEVLSADEFEKVLNDSTEKLILDVRTPDEFNSGRIENAVNIDYNSSDFSNKISVIDTNRHIMIYCLSGSRSHSAAMEMRSKGFKVSELDGGILAWKKLNKPLTGVNEKVKGMSKADFNKLVNEQPVTLVDFYAPWCEPCKKLSPVIEKVAEEKSIKLIKINIDDNESLSNDLNVYAIPVIQVYKNGVLFNSHTGLLSAIELKSMLE